MRGALRPHRKLGTLALLAGVVVVSGLSEPALAFRPSSVWITDHAMNKKLKRNIRTLKVEQEVTVFGDESAPRGYTVEGQTLVLAPSGFRQTRQTKDGDKEILAVYSKQQMWVRGEDGNDQVKRYRGDVLVDFFTASEPMSRWDAGERLQKSLQAMKVDVDNVSFARFSGAVNFVVGAKPWEKDKAQVWFDKETLLLTRIIRPEARATGKTVRVDIRLLGWGSPEGGSWFPKTIEVYEDDVLKERWITKSVERNKNLGAELFEIRK